MTDDGDVARAAGALMGSQGAAAALRICDTQIATASRLRDLDGLARWQAIKAAISAQAREPGA